LIVGEVETGKIGDGIVFGGGNCNDFEEVEVGEDGIRKGVSVGAVERVEDGDDRGISKISTTSEYPLENFPPPKNILFVDDVDASK
jgi:hypothetical protein